MATHSKPDRPPEITSGETVDAIVEASKRKQDFPLRREFVQQRLNGSVIPGPMSELVRAGDHRAVLLYLLLITKASAAPWDAALPAAVWARALGIDLPDSKTARSTVSKIWARLERNQLVKRSRRDRLADVFLLREDGQGADYESPGGSGDSYAKVPLALWQVGPTQDRRWFQDLTLPELAVLLIGRTLSDGFWLPFENGPEWYGISADTISRGVTGLKNRGLIDIEKQFKKAPLSAVGYTAEHHYTLQAPFGPIGHRSQNRRASAAAGSPPADRSPGKRRLRTKSAGGA